ncbi:hypothetical protein QUA42_18500 [Microcoleus sp. Pol11C2]
MRSIAFSLLILASLATITEACFLPLYIVYDRTWHGAIAIGRANVS